MKGFKRTVVGLAELETFREVLVDYEVMVVTVLDAILDRYEKHPEYHFIDTKLSMLTGEDFPVLADQTRDFKSRTAIYAWIQGRGLEALVGHARWLDRCSVLSDAEKTERRERLRRMIAEVFEQMESIRAKNHGRLFFTMTPEGEPFALDETGRRRPIRLKGRSCGFSDLFYAKGMLAAASFLKREEKIDEAKRCFRSVLSDIRQERFADVQISFDRKNVRRAAPGRFPQGPRMIAIGGCALFAELSDEDEWFEVGETLIRGLTEEHLNTGQFDELEPYDYFEHRDADGEPWKENGQVLSDPGHSLEFVGLAAKFLLLLETRDQKTTSQTDLLERCRALLPKVFVRNFRNGFNERIGGICKSFDLISRTPINDDMPWWNLPETMRAAAELLILCPNAEERADIVRALVACSNGFMTRFVNPDAHLMAYQTINAAGKPVDVIPATPDADPGYHTGLSLIDMLDCFAKLGG